MFSTHMLNDQGKKEVAELKTALSLIVSKASLLIPEGREKALFLTKMEEASFFATKAVASKNGNYSQVIPYPEVQE